MGKNQSKLQAKAAGIQKKHSVHQGTRVLAALGGNALVTPGQKGTEDEMKANVTVACQELCAVAKVADLCCVSHGNGPQVGAVVLQNELSKDTIPAMDLTVCGSETQGMLGYLLGQGLNNEFKKAGVVKDVCTVVTQVVVDAADPGFQNPTKPIGQFYAEEVAGDMKKKGVAMKEDAGRGWRRVVASPKPKEIVELAAIQNMAASGILTIACGGGGIPVVREKDRLKGVEAVIDKDLASALLAEKLDCDVLLIMTDVDSVYLDWGKEEARRLARLTVEEALKYASEGQFSEGSMKPKVEAAVQFVQNTGGRAFICSLAGASDVLSGKKGTEVYAEKEEKPGLLDGVDWPKDELPVDLDNKIAELAKKYTPLACEILKEAVRIPADYVNKPAGEGGDPLCGTSNHERHRVEYLRDAIIKNKSVACEDDCFFDAFGNLVWTVQDKDDGIPADEKKVIFFDGHTDTVMPLPEEWKRKTGGVDVYDGLVKEDKVDVDFLSSELGYLPPKAEWKHLIFGRGTADQLSGVIQQIIATKIMLELKDQGALKGVIIRAYGTVAEEDNDGGGPMYVLQKELPGASPERIPDVVIHTEGTGDKHATACGIYIGQRGRMQIEVEVVGKSCHGSMPWEGLNPLEFGSRIILEAREQYDNGDTFLSDDFLGGGTRTASWCNLATPSDCAVPASFVFRFDRRITVGETPAECLANVEALGSVELARKAGLTVNVRIPKYTTPTWKGYIPGNDQVYMGWLTTPEHEAVQTSYATWKRTVTHQLPKDHKDAFDKVPKEPRIGRWIFSTDGVAYPIPEDEKKTGISVPASKKWVSTGSGYHHPAQIGMGIGYEQNTHKIGEFIDSRHFPAAIAFCARFASLYYERSAAGIQDA